MSPPTHMLFAFPGQNVSEIHPYCAIVPFAGVIHILRWCHGGGVLGVHAVHRVHLIRPRRGGILGHAVLEARPAREEFLQLLVLGLELGHVSRSGHVCRSRWRLGCLPGVCSRHKVGEVGLDSAQALDVLFRGHGFAHIESTQLLLVLRVDGTATTLGLQVVNFLEEFAVDIEE